MITKKYKERQRGSDHKGMQRKRKQSQWNIKKDRERNHKGIQRLKEITMEYKDRKRARNHNGIKSEINILVMTKKYKGKK